MAVIEKAEKQIRVQAYSFTSKAIADALVAAATRKVDVQVILDDGNRTDKNSVAGVVKAGGITPLFDAKHAISHNKIIIVDEKVVVTGSFNFTNAAEKSNAENITILRSQKLAARYVANWNTHKEHAAP